MQFTWRKTGDRVFQGPDKRMGILAEFSVATMKSFKAANGIRQIDDLDSMELQCAYCLLAIRAEEPGLIGLKEFTALKLADFDIAPHDVVDLDDDGDCAGCGQPIDSKYHTGVAIPPTNPADADEPASADQSGTTADADPTETP